MHNIIIYSVNFINTNQLFKETNIYILYTIYLQVTAEKKPKKYIYIKIKYKYICIYK